MMINGSNLPISRAYAGGFVESSDSGFDCRFLSDPVDTFELSANATDDGFWRLKAHQFRAPVNQPGGRGVGVFMADGPGHGEMVESVLEREAGGVTISRGNFPRDWYYQMTIPDNATLQSCASEVDKALASPFDSARKVLDGVTDQRVVNMSFGVSIELIYSELARRLRKNIDKDGGEIVAFVKGRLETAGTPGNQARDSYRKKVDDLAKQGVTVVVAAGNGDANRGVSKDWAKHDKDALRNVLADPGSKALSVGATNEDGSPSPHGAPSTPDLAAPSIPPKGEKIRGTSWSAPYVAATIAMMLEVNPRLSHARIREILLEASQPQGPGQERFVGKGVLNRDKALELARTST